jgi:putative transposase
MMLDTVLLISPKPCEEHMPWQKTDSVNERLRFVAQVQEGLYSIPDLSARYGVSRQTGYTTVDHYNELGVDGLKDGSHAPKHCPHRITEEMRELLLESRRAHPTWGPRKILAWLRPRYPELALPAASTVGDLYSREMLVKRRPRRREWSQPGRATVAVNGPNDLWTIDFKGEFRTLDGLYCYPLTIADAHTRFLLAVDGLPSAAHAGARVMVERVFREYGLPAVIRSDNGGPFATKAIAGLSRLNVWWTQLGIKQVRYLPGRVRFRAAARSAGDADAGLALHALAARTARAPARAGVPRALRRPPGTCEWDPVFPGQEHLSERAADRPVHRS